MRAHELAKYMVAKPPVDNTKNLLSPMPGKLVSVFVKPGQEVEEGQELCIVEAMKMQNMLRAPKHTKVSGHVLPRSRVRCVGVMHEAHCECLLCPVLPRPRVRYVGVMHEAHCARVVLCCASAELSVLVRVSILCR